MRLKILNTKIRLTLLLVTLCAFFALYDAVYAENPAKQVNITKTTPPPENPNDFYYYIPDEMVVKFTDDTVQTWAFAERVGGTILDHLENADVYLIRMNRIVNPTSLADEFDTMQVVEYAHPNYLINSLHPVQGSYPFSDGTRTGDYDNQPPARSLNLSTAHDQATGNGVTVGIIDGGIDYTYPVLADRVVSGYDFVDNDNNAFDEPGGNNTGHGTFVAGVVHLVAPEATLKSYRITSPDGTGDGFTLAKAIEQATLDGCDVINLSVVLFNEHLAVRDAIDFAEAQNVTIIAAAGNDYSEGPVYPAAQANVLAVSAIDEYSQLADFSNYGSHIDVCAPGKDIYSTYKDTYYAWWSGTSFATPFVSGEAALLKEKAPYASAWEIKTLIKNSATNIDTINPFFAGKLGNGLINPVAALGSISLPATAEVIPETLTFVVEEGTSFPTSPFESFTLTSSNAPAQYVGRLSPIGSDPVFLYPDDTLYGSTDDTITVFLADWDFPVGIYYNMIRFYVMGVEGPVDLIISLTITEGTPVETAQVIPDELYFTAPYGMDTLLFAQALLTSTNAPAAFTATTLSGGSQVSYPFDTTGTTIDSITVAVNTALAPQIGHYRDTIAYYVEGVSEPAYVHVFLEIQDTMPAGDSAWVFQDSLSYMTIVEGSNTTIYDAFLVNSSNAPAGYIVEYHGTPLFTALLDSNGTTNGYTHFKVHAPELPVGLYNDTLLFYVNGVVNNPVMGILVLEVIPDGTPADSAWIFPDTLYFTLNEGESLIEPPSYYFSIFSSNAPATFTVKVIDTDLVFVYPYDTIYGTTNDSVEIAAYNCALPNCDYHFPPGCYTNLVQVMVEGAAQPEYLLVNLTVKDTSTTGTVSITPNHLNFSAKKGTEETLTGRAFLTSNPPGIYTAVLSGYGFTTTEPDSAVSTPDSVTIFVHPALVPNPGYYYDSVAYYVQGISQPAYLYITLQITEDTVNHSAWVNPAYFGFEAPYGKDTILTSSVFVSSTNAPALFNVIIPDPVDFVQLQDSVGYTDTYIYFNAVSTSSMAPGIYVDTLLFYVDGVINNPRKSVVYLHVDTLPGNDTAWVYPYAQAYTAPYGVNYDQTGSVFVGSSNAPAPITFKVRDYVDFILLPDCCFSTGDTVLFSVTSTSSMPMGVYVDTLEFFVEGVHNNPYIAIVYLQIDTSGSPGSVCCEMPGDLNNNGIAYELTDKYLLENVLYLGSLSHLSCPGNADINGDCLVDIDDFELMRLIITGESPVMINECSSCQDYTVIQDTVIHGAYLNPGSLSFELPYASNDTIITAVFIGSDNTPATYYANVIGGPESFIHLLDSVGITNYDSVMLMIVSSDLLPGNYRDSVIFYIEGISNPIFLTVSLTITNQASVDYLTNYPNPFNPKTNIAYTLTRATHIRLEIYNILGQEVKVLVDEYQAAGEHEITWEGKDSHGREVSSGIYFYRLETAETSLTRKMLLLK